MGKLVMQDLGKLFFGGYMIIHSDIILKMSLNVIL